MNLANRALSMFADRSLLSCQSSGKGNVCGCDAYVVINLRDSIKAQRFHEISNPVTKL